MPNLRRPAHLVPGSTVALFASSFRFDRTLFDQAVVRLSRFFQVIPIYDESVFETENYFAGSDERRFSELYRYLTQPKIEALFLIRGGYGSTRFLPALMRKLRSKKKTLTPKIVIGQSDLTPFLNFLNQDMGWSSFHGPVLVGRAFREPVALEEETFTRSLFSTEPLGKLTGYDMQPWSKGKVRGRIVGGNLCLIASSLGTAYELDTAGKILFLEEVTESPYRVDRMLTQLLHAGKFDRIKGLIFGQMTKCLPTETTQGTSIEMAIQSALSPLLEKRKIPILYNFPAGHGNPQITFPLGTNIELLCKSSTCAVTFLESGTQKRRK